MQSYNLLEEKLCHNERHLKSFDKGIKFVIFKNMFTTTNTKSIPYAYEEVLIQYSYSDPPVYLLEWAKESTKLYFELDLVQLGRQDNSLV